ncbi:MAG: prephenate dehydratase domain-containing protein [Pirellulaceae bacterium]
MSDLTSIADLDRQLLELIGRRLQLLRCEGSNAAPLNPPVAGQSPGLTPEPLMLDECLAERIGLPLDDLRTLVRHVESICQRSVGQRSPVVFLGPIYSYSYLAAVKHFGLGADLVPVTTISAAFEELVRGQAKFGVVPIENSTDGRIVDTLGMFARSPVQICGEVLLPVHHCLLGRCSRAEVTMVQSKPQALSQCRNWLCRNTSPTRSWSK